MSERPMTIREGTPADHEPLTGVWLRSVRATHVFLASARLPGGRSLRDRDGRPYPLLHVADNQGAP